MVCGLEFRGETCPAQTEYDDELGVYLHPDNAGIERPQKPQEGRLT